ncbi:MAG: radical SAM protein [Candidatus Omnitrophota bacterium]|nr:radical SAM protein [Candidatus Omnitrophota bacterium]MDZ4243179.1 radical SAM protein [Candidatus Omnitrophota bacterium]
MIPYDVEVDWLITEVCNFDCPFCWLQKRPKSDRYLGRKDTQELLEGFNNKGVTWLVHMTGGEPFFFPNFLELCRGLTERHYISINTNLSHKNVLRFAETVDPEKVDFMHVSLHILEREKMRGVGRFIDTYMMLKNAGFNIFVSYLMYPPLMKRFPKDYEDFKSRGVILRPKVYWGDYYGVLDAKVKRPCNNRILKYLGRAYPDAYSAEQVRFIREYIDRSARDEAQRYGNTVPLRERTVDLALDKHWVSGIPSYAGKRCSAGRKMVRMEKDGEVYRCIDEKRYHLGNMFRGPLEFLKEDLVCGAPLCSCPYVGLRYANNESKDERYPL